MPYCGEHTAVNYEGETRRAASLRCRSWLCPNCRDDRKRQLVAEGIGGRPDTFLTLTSRRRPDIPEEEAAAALTHAWSVLRKRAIREAARDTTKNPLPFGAAPKDGWRQSALDPARRRIVLHDAKLPFLAVVEKTELGWPHLHLLLRSKWLDAEWLSAQMLDLLDSPIIKIERLFRASKAAVYCAKYCGKATHKFTSTKRYWKSQDYERRPNRGPKHRRGPPIVWERSKAPLRFILERWLHQGFDVTFESAWKVTARRRRPPDQEGTPCG